MKKYIRLFLFIPLLGNTLFAADSLLLDNNQNQEERANIISIYQLLSDAWDDPNMLESLLKNDGNEPAEESLRRQLKVI